jgi:hypothetical protein
MKVNVIDPRKDKNNAIRTKEIAKEIYDLQRYVDGDIARTFNNTIEEWNFLAKKLKLYKNKIQKSTFKYFKNNMEVLGNEIARKFDIIKKSEINFEILEEE